ncbi:MAG: tetratricopeptide repeat protein [Nitrospirota bacterium]|nr:MAG: tetratricopeptide repeat protein [Nitrospirota bacterium]
MRKIAVILVLLMSFSSSADAITARQLEKVEELKTEALELLRKKEFDKAVPVLNEILAIDPLEKTANRYLNLAKQQAMEPFCQEAAEAFMKDDYASAIDSWEKILRMNPGDQRFSRLIEITKNLVSDKTIDEMYSRANDFLEKGDRNSAANELEKILSIKPYDRRAREMLAKAKQSVSSAKTKKHYDQADQYMKQKKYDLAIEEWNKVLAIDDSQQAAKRLIASAIREKIQIQYSEAEKLYRKGDYLSARDNYYKILVDNPTDLDVKTIISNLDDTTKIVNRMDERGKAYDIMRTSLSNHIAIDGNKKAAVAAAWYAVQIDPQNTTALAIKNYMEMKYATLVATMEPPIGSMNIIDQYLFAALNHIYEGRYDMSIQETGIVIALDPDSLLAWKRLGSAYFAMGEKKKARNAWQRALKIDPNDKELKQFIKQAK